MQAFPASPMGVIDSPHRKTVGRPNISSKIDFYSQISTFFLSGYILENPKFFEKSGY
jgi:hypothetical protein